MLVLSRELNQEICIGPNVVVRVVDVRGGKVRLGIVAPEEVSVDRREVRESKEGQALREKAALEVDANETGRPEPTAA